MPDAIMEVDVGAVNGVLERLAAEQAPDPVAVRALEMAALAVLFAYSEAVRARFAEYVRVTSGALTDEEREKFTDRLRALGIIEE